MPVKGPSPVRKLETNAWGIGSGNEDSPVFTVLSLGVDSSFRISRESDDGYCGLLTLGAFTVISLLARIIH